MSDPSNDLFKQQAGADWEVVANGWRKWHATFENAASNMSTKIMDMAEVREGASVLDIATGIGDPAIAVARRVGRRGSVLAMDISEQMLTIAKKRAIKDQVDGIINFNRGDAATMALPELAFDSALCRLGLMFIIDLDKAMSNIYKSLVSGGNFAASVWSTSDKVPQLALAMEVVRNELKLPPVPQNTTGSPFSLADVNFLKLSFIKCGFKDLKVQRINVRFEFNSAEEFTNFTKDIAAPVVALLNGQTPDRKNQIWRAVTEATASGYTNNDIKSVILDNEAICICGKKK